MYELTQENTGNLDTIIKKKNSFIRFHSPNCGHCQSMEPEWKLLENKKLPIQLININVHLLNDKMKSECVEKARSQGVPFMVFVNKKGKIEEEYKGNRSANDMIEFIKSKSNTLLKSSRISSRPSRKRLFSSGIPSYSKSSRISSIPSRKILFSSGIPSYSKKTIRSDTPYPKRKKSKRRKKSRRKKYN